MRPWTLEKLREKLKVATIRSTSRQPQGSREETKGLHITEPWKAPPSGRHEKREVDNGQDSVKNQKKVRKRVLVCYSCGGKGPARLCPTPPDHATQAVDEEGDADEESVRGRMGLSTQLCGGEEDNVLGIGWESTE